MISPFDGGMYGLKLVSPVHFDIPFFANGNPTLMNFPDTKRGHAIAAAIPIGHKAVVYETSPRQRFTAAIEFIDWPSGGSDLLMQGLAAARAQNAIGYLLTRGVPPRWASVFRCIRILRMAANRAQAPTRAAMQAATGLAFHFKQGDIMFGINQATYQTIYSAI